MIWASMTRWLFPKWANTIRPLIALGAAGGGLYVATLVPFAFHPASTDAGYMPKQPVEYSHLLHAGKLGIDCRYCHSTVESTGHAAIPAVQTCMNCHARLGKDNPKIKPVRDAWEKGEPIQWIKVHRLPDYVYFNHSAHVTRGIGCVSCHSRIDRMETVYQYSSLNMGWCLDCHRAPEKAIRPKDKITQMDFKAEDMGTTQEELGKKLREEYKLNPSTDCSTCHR